MDRSHEVCWMCLSTLDARGVRFDIPGLSQRHNVALCSVCHGHPKRDQIAQRLEDVEQRLRKHEPPEAI